MKTVPLTESSFRILTRDRDWPANHHGPSPWPALQPPVYRADWAGADWAGPARPHPSTNSCTGPLDF